MYATTTVVSGQYNANILIPNSVPVLADTQIQAFQIDQNGRLIVVGPQPGIGSTPNPVIVSGPTSGLTLSSGTSVDETQAFFSPINNVSGQQMWQAAFERTNYFLQKILLELIRMNNQENPPISEEELADLKAYLYGGTVGEPQLSVD